MTARRSEDAPDMALGRPCSWLAIVEGRYGRVCSENDRACPTLLHVCSLAPRVALGRLRLCLVAAVLAIASVCRANPIHGGSGDHVHGRRVNSKSKSKSTRHARRVSSRRQRCCEAAQSWSCRTREMASNVPPSSFVLAGAGGQSLASNRSAAIHARDLDDYRGVDPFVCAKVC